MNNILTIVSFLCTYTDHYHVTGLSTSKAPGQGAATVLAGSVQLTDRVRCKLTGYIVFLGNIILHYVGANLN